MANIFFIKPFLTALQEGKSVRFGIFILLWIIAVAVIVGGAVQWIDFWNQVSGEDAAGVFGVILYQIIYVVLIYLVFQILVIRASDVLNAEAFESEFTVIPIMSVLARAFGEIAAVSFTMQGVGLLIFLWFAGATPMGPGSEFFQGLILFTGLVVGTGFKGGILALVYGIIFGFISIVLAYFTAEVIILGLKWYLDIKVVRRVAEGYEKPGTRTKEPASTAEPSGTTSPPKKPKKEEKPLGGKGGSEESQAEPGSES